MLVPKKTVLSPYFPKIFERIAMFICGTYIAIMLIFNIQALWIIGALLWTVSACASYLGYVQWNILWKSKASSKTQMTMFFWDAFIALSCLVKL